MRFYTSLVLFTASILMLFFTFVSTTDARFLRNKNLQTGFKQARSTRGFKGAALQVGRGFGKRASEQNDFFLDLDDNALTTELDGMADSFPLDWVVDKMENNPSFARSVLRKFVDINGDGLLTMDELLRPTY